MWDTTTMLSVLTMTWECARNGRKWVRARWTALNSRPFMCQARYLTVQTLQAGLPSKTAPPPPPTLRGKHPSLSFGDSRLPPYSLLSRENWGPATPRGCGDRRLTILVGGGMAKRGEYPGISSTRGTVSYGAAPREEPVKPLPWGLRACSTGPLTRDGVAWRGPITIGCFLHQQWPDGPASRLSPDRPPKMWSAGLEWACSSDLCRGSNYACVDLV